MLCEPVILMKNTIHYSSLILVQLTRAFGRQAPLNHGCVPHAEVK